MDNFIGDEDYEALGTEASETLKENINIETIERCMVCGQSFKSRWGILRSCDQHTGLVKTVAPPRTKKTNRKSAKYFEWRHEILRNHEYKCDECGSSANLSVHASDDDPKVLCREHSQELHRDLRTIKEEYDKKMRLAKQRVN